jgi:hypothetical protein
MKQMLWRTEMQTIQLPSLAQYTEKHPQFFADAENVIELFEQDNALSARS